jgi:hypothetical protein
MLYTSLSEKLQPRMFISVEKATPEQLAKSFTSSVSISFFIESKSRGSFDLVNLDVGADVIDNGLRLEICHKGLELF